jgi:hypothetical protein
MRGRFFGMGRNGRDGKAKERQKNKIGGEIGQNNRGPKE